MKNNNTDTKPIFIFLMDPSFQGVNRLFVLSLENHNGKKAHK